MKPAQSEPTTAPLLRIHPADHARAETRRILGAMPGWLVGCGARAELVARDEPNEARAGNGVAMQFYVGLHQPSDAQRFDACMVSIRRLEERVSDFAVGEWMMDSGAFMELKLHGRYRYGADVYAAHIARWARCGKLAAAVAQDYMCEPCMLARTGLTVADHQRLTISRYDALRCHARASGVYILPVLQGYKPQEYVAHIRQYGCRLALGAWVGVGSVCKRNGDPDAIAAVLLAIKAERPDLRLHGFGLKTTALGSDLILSLLHSADSMAWSFAARKARRGGDLSRSANDWREAEAFVTRIGTQPVRAHGYQHSFMEAA
jgi:hypothetical protein